MIGVINPLPFFLLAWLALFTVLLMPSMYFSWKVFQLYVGVSLVVAFGSWYCTKLDSAIVLVVGLTSIFSQLIGCWLQAGTYEAPTRFTPGKFAALILSLAISVPVTMEALKRTWYRTGLPDDIPRGTFIFIPRQINAGCEIVVWTFERRALPDSVSKSWQTTPYKLSRVGEPTDQWLSGLGSSSASLELQGRIGDSVLGPGSFYRHSKATGILVAPEAGFVVKFLGAE